MIADPIQRRAAPLLQPGDPEAVVRLNADSDAPVVLVCEHAGQAIPIGLGDLGLGAVDRARHIGWDIGAGAVTRKLAAALGAPAVLLNYSRLVIDCNRPPEAEDSIPEISDGIGVPGNVALRDEDRAMRIAALFDPFQAAVSALLRSKPRLATLSVHSFTPRMGGTDRPWDVGLLHRHDTTTAERLRRYLLEADPALCIGMNQPYQIDDASDWFVPRHGEASGLAHCLIEIRNDHIRDTAGQSHWAALLTDAINRLTKELTDAAYPQPSAGR